MPKATTPARTPDLRVERYRRAGWWRGESLVDTFARHVSSAPSMPAVVDDRGVALTRRELWDRAGEQSGVLESAGVSAGDVVLVSLANSAQWQVWFLACLRLRAVPATIPVSTDRVTLAHVLNLVCARAVVAEASVRRYATGDWARSLAADSDGAAAAIVVNSDGTAQVTTPGGSTKRTPAPPEVEHIMFTSSSTGMPKAVMHTADTLGAGNITFAQRYDLSERTPLFMPSPLGHSVGSWHGGRLSLFLGAELVLQEHWDPARGLDLIDAHECAFTAAATPFLKDLVDVDRPQPKMTSLKTFLCGGAPVPPVLLEQAAHQAPDTLVSVLWGMTEGAGTTCLPVGPRGKITSTAGLPVPGLELAVLDPDRSGSGELAIRGPQVFVGYLGQEELYRTVVTEDGFFRTGDLASIDAEGYLHLTGRLKDMIIRGGVNISPVPIEDAVAAHPAVRRVAVIGEPDERMGERICVVIVPSGDAPTLEELNDWLTARGVPTRKLPEVLRVVEDMPVTAAGKIRKVDLRRQVGGTHD